MPTARSEQSLVLLDTHTSVRLVDGVAWLRRIAVAAARAFDATISTRDAGILHYAARGYCKAVRV